MDVVACACEKVTVPKLDNGRSEPWSWEFSTIHSAFSWQRNGDNKKKCVTVFPRVTFSMTAVPDEGPDEVELAVTVSFITSPDRMGMSSKCSVNPINRSYQASEEREYMYMEMIKFKKVTNRDRILRHWGT